MLVGTGMLVIDDRLKDKPKLLLIRRVEEKWWELPGGKVDDGELPEDAILRELNEETNLVAKTCLKVGEHPHWGIKGGRNWWLSQYYLVYFHQLQTPVEPRFRELDKHDGLDWFPLTDPPTPISETALKGFEIVNALLASEAEIRMGTVPG